jgi:hypothetical protein
MIAVGSSISVKFEEQADGLGLFSVYFCILNHEKDTLPVISCNLDIPSYIEVIGSVDAHIGCKIPYDCKKLLLSIYRVESLL